MNLSTENTIAMEVSVDQLQRAIEGQHGGKAVLVTAEPVKEVFEGKTVWEGVVQRPERTTDIT
jgi:hypothetical protein